MQCAAAATRSTAGDPRRRHTWLSLVLVALFAVSQAQPAAAVMTPFVKLSDGVDFNDIDRWQISTDAKWVVYEFQDDLWSVPIDGSLDPLRISGILPPLGLKEFAITADSQRVVYRATEDTTHVAELYSVSIAGGSSVKLNGDRDGLAPIVLSFAVSPLSDRVVYVAEEETDAVFELFSVSIHGGMSVKLNGTLTAGGEVLRALVSPAGDRAVYAADQQTDDVWELFSVPIGGGMATKLNGPLVPGGGILLGFQISPTGSRVVYRADEDSNDVFELFSVPITGGTPVKLNGPLASGGDTVFYDISPQGHRVVYVADQQTAGRNELYSVPITGGTAAKLNGALIAGGEVFGFDISPAGNRVTYLATQESLQLFELYSVPIEDGTVVKLNGELVAGGDVFESRFSRDGQWVFYRSDQIIDGWPLIFRAPAAGPSGNDELVSNRVHDVFWKWALDPLSDRLLVASNSPFIDGIVRPWAVPTRAPLMPSGIELVDEGFFQPDGDIREMQVASDGTLVYLADQEVDEKFELYAVPGPVLFRDGFESGDATAWSATTP